jgi:hypothetical protein
MTSSSLWAGMISTIAGGRPAGGGWRAARRVDSTNNAM